MRNKCWYENTRNKSTIDKKIEAADDKVLKQLEILLNSFEKEEGDWFYELSPELKHILKKSLDRSEREETIPDEQVMRENSAKYGLKENLNFDNPPQEIRDLLEIAQKQVANG